MLELRDRRLHAESCGDLLEHRFLVHELPFGYLLYSDLVFKLEKGFLDLVVGEGQGVKVDSGDGNDLMLDVLVCGGWGVGGTVLGEVRFVVSGGAVSRLGCLVGVGGLKI